MPESVTIILNTFELRVCKTLGKERYDVDVANNIVDRKADPKRTGVDISISGTKGEFAVAKYLNLYPDFTTHIRGGGCDLYHGEMKIDVKNAHPHQNLMTPTFKKLGEADIYICIAGDNPFKILGWCYEKELINPDRIAKWTPVESYFLKREELRDIRELKKIIHP